MAEQTRYSVVDRVSETQKYDCKTGRNNNEISFTGLDLLSDYLKKYHSII